jgi:hypothetical protein
MSSVSHDFSLLCVEGILSDVAQKRENDSSGAQMKIRANFFSPRFPRSGNLYA